jgi:hypothetical protein
MNSEEWGQGGTWGVAEFARIPGPRRAVCVSRRGGFARRLSILPPELSVLLAKPISSGSLNSSKLATFALNRIDRD